MSYLITAQTGEPVTPAMLLGTEEQVNAAKEAEAEAHLADLEKRMEQAGLLNG